MTEPAPAGVAGTLTVKVIEARNLKAGAGAPVCALFFEKQETKTVVATGGDAPQWNEDFLFDVTSSQSELLLSVWDSTNQDFLGQVKIRTGQLASQKQHQQWFKLVPRAVKDKIKGDIHVALTFVGKTPGQRMCREDFDLLKVLGKGSFGKVLQVRKKDTGRIYAMKVLNKETVIARDEVVHTRAEQRVLGMVNHPFIVGLKFSFQTPDKLYLVLDYVQGGELFFHLQQEVKFSEERCRFYAAELALAIDYLHSLNIVYRDLKPENILIDEHGHICITDFGLCKENMADGEETKTFCGTAEYLAPEVLKGDGYTKAVDWWSLGVLLFEMMNGLPPFYSDNTNLMYKKIMYSELKFPPETSPNAANLIEGLLKRDPAERLGTRGSGIEEIKAHPFFESINWVRMSQRAVDPPWRPVVAGATDTANFDPTFTDQVAEDSPPTASAIGAAGAGNHFDGFTYTSQSAIGNA